MTKHQPGTLEALAEILARRISTAQGHPPRLHVVAGTRRPRWSVPRPPDLSECERRLCITYRLNGRQTQGVFHIPGVAPLSDLQLSGLREHIEKTRGCHVESIVYEIVSPQLDRIPALQMLRHG